MSYSATEGVNSDTALNYNYMYMFDPHRFPLPHLWNITYNQKHCDETKQTDLAIWSQKQQQQQQQQQQNRHMTTMNPTTDIDTCSQAPMRDPSFSLSTDPPSRN